MHVPKSKQKIVMGWTWKHVINTVKTLRSKVNVVSGSWMYETHPGFEIHYIKLPKWELKYLICELRIWKLAKNCELIFSRKICFFPVLSISFVRNSLFRSPLLNAWFERSTWLTQKSHVFSNEPMRTDVVRTAATIRLYQQIQRRWSSIPSR